VLARHLDVADSPEERVTVRVKLALVAEQKLGQTKEAIDQLSELLAETPDHPEANEALERLLAKEGRHDELVAQLERRADRARDLGDEAEELRVLVRMGEALHLHVGDRERAAQCYERVLERDPEHVDALRALSSLYVERGDSERGAEILERLLGRIEGEELVSVAHQLAELSEQQLNAPGRAQAALLRAAQAGVRLDETQKLQLAFYERQGDYASLAELLGEQVESIEDVAERVTGLRRIAEIYRDKLTDPRRACDYLERASQLVPDDRSVLVPLCELYIEAGRQESAVPVLEKIIASYGGRRVKEIAIYHRMLANAYRGMGDAERALGELDAAYRVDLTNVAVLVDLGMLCYERGDLERAQKTFRGLLLQRLDKDAPITKADVYFYLGDIAGKQGDKPKAISMLERAVAEQSDHLRARELLDSLRA
jgi:tetratricopeptide (TPR) repeat protein